MSVETHPSNSTGHVGEPTSGADFRPGDSSHREPSGVSPNSTGKAKARCNLEPRERAPKAEGRGGFGLGRLLLTVLTSIAGGALGAWGFQQANIVPSPPPAISSSTAVQDVKPPSIGSSSSSIDEADDEQNKVISSLRADLDRLRVKLYAVQLKLNGTDSVAKPEQTPELTELKSKVAELTIQTDRLGQLSPRIRTIDERIDQLSVMLKSMRDDLQAVQELSTKSVGGPRRGSQAGIR